MTAWGWFLGTTGAVVLLALIFATLTARTVRDALASAPPGPLDPERVLGMSRRALYANAVLSQALLLTILWVAIVLTGVDWSHFGVGGDLDLVAAVGLGLALGIVLAGVNVASHRLFDRLSLSYDESLRRLLMPASTGDWVVLLLVVLPVVAIFEEVLFRGALIGAAAVGLAVSPWVLVVGSAFLFALGHGLQGIGGLVAAGALGLILGGAFVLSGSLLLVIVAHYVINVLEFVTNRA